MNRRNMPVIITLSAGAISLFLSMVRNDSLLRRTVTLLLVIIVFYLLSRLIQNLLDYFDKQNELKKQAEGEIIQKESEEASKKESSNQDS